MLSMFGFIKKELDDQKKLPAKFGGWKNILFAESGKEFMESSIPVRSNVLLFAPPSKEVPVDLLAKPWEFSCVVNAIKFGTSPVQHPQHCIAIVGNPWARFIFTMKCHRTGFEAYEWSSGSWKSFGLTGSVKAGANYIKIAYVPKTSTSGTFTGYYSLNGSNWTQSASWNYTQIDSNFRPCKIAVMNGGPPDVPADSSSVPVSSIKFVYDGEVLFGK